MTGSYWKLLGLLGLLSGVTVGILALRGVTEGLLVAGVSGDTGYWGGVTGKFLRLLGAYKRCRLARRTRN